MKSPEQLIASFRAQGLKVTPQRVAVFQALHGNGTHPTAESVYEAVRSGQPTISLRTVYQVLNDLAAAGEINQLDLGTGSTRFDPNTGEHHHLVCDGCGVVRDVVLDSPVPTAPAAAAGEFVVQSTEVVFRGRCAECAAAVRKGSAVSGVDGDGDAAA